MGKNIVFGKFEWDEEKANIYVQKHHISFKEILPIFDDPLFWERTDELHSSIDEQRFIGIGKLENAVVVITAFTEKNGRTRIINARLTTKKEEDLYEQRCKQLYT